MPRGHVISFAGVLGPWCGTDRRSPVRRALSDRPTAERDLASP
ncbi:hypothetical protein UO65_1050 [Actinokineospora spheciospongiae]|uniref:Uncharacterized protein n=1 Tax=Actinokineospora spheciospongiae TaxID=909613 RepID=W7J3N7_9PSEU|nr:hypothetical protein UO65_1050 [Actinokineospora spheciospongiae]